MSRSIAVAVLAGVLASAAVAAPGRQLVAPELNPGLRTVPFVPSSTSVKASTDCEKKLVARIDSGTIITGPDARVAHLTGMADGVADGKAELVIVSISSDGTSATADLMACASRTFVTPEPVAASLPLTAQANLRTLTVRAQSNSVTLNAGH